MPVDHIELAGRDDRAPHRRKAWEALGKWIASRLARQRELQAENGPEPEPEPEPEP